MVKIPLQFVGFYRFIHAFEFKEIELNTYQGWLVCNIDEVYSADSQKPEAEVKQKEGNIIFYGHLFLACPRLPRPWFSLKSS